MSSEGLKIGLAGSLGRMGEAVRGVLKEAGNSPAVCWDAGDDFSSGMNGLDVVIDFSHASATLSLAEACAAEGVPLVTGTTGHSREEKNVILEVLSAVPVVWAGNFSVGVNLWFHLCAEAAKKLPREFEVEIVEMHHRLKKDAPSGTAMQLVDILVDALERVPSDVVFGREGETGERRREEIAVHALRGGDVIGDHTTIFAGPAERLEITHRASHRGIFAQGAFRAAQWVVGKDARLYDMRHVLGLVTL